MFFIKASDNIKLPIIVTLCTFPPTILKIRSLIPVNYAFHAQLTSTVINDYVIYDNVLTNEGAAYDNTTGIFTCKSSGTYVFSWTTAKSNCRDSRAYLLVSEISIGVTNTHRRQCYYWSENVGSSTGFVAYNLQLGDEVKVKVNGTADALFSTLSGWRLHQGTFYKCSFLLYRRPLHVYCAVAQNRYLTKNVIMSLS